MEHRNSLIRNDGKFHGKEVDNFCKRRWKGGEIKITREFRGKQ